MALPPESFQLDRKLFNQDLYTHIRSIWFAGVPADAKRQTDEAVKRWWGKGATPEERKAFDEKCRANFGGVLDSISPSHIALPTFTSYADDLSHAAQISAPFLQEITTASATDPKQGALTLLSLIILLDQMPRNIHRDPAGLHLVYTHYDRLAWTLVQASHQLDPNPSKHPFFRGNHAYAAWLSIPLMHAEDLASQNACIAHLQRIPEEAREMGDLDVANAGEVQWNVEFGKSHRDIISQFGRFPHRNEGLGREGTHQETEWLKTGETFGVEQAH